MQYFNLYHKLIIKIKTRIGDKMRLIDKTLFLRGIMLWCLLSLVSTFFAPSVEFLAGLLGTIVLIMSFDSNINQKNPELAQLKSKLKIMVYMIIGITIIDFTQNIIPIGIIPAIIELVEPAIGLYVLKLAIEMLRVDAGILNNTIQVDKLNKIWLIGVVVMAAIGCTYLLSVFVRSFNLIALTLLIAKMTFVLIKIVLFISFYKQLETKK